MPAPTPLTLAQLADLIPIDTVNWDLQWFEELGGSSDGRIWSTDLSPPLWAASITVAPRTVQIAKELAARFRQLKGSKIPFMLFDPQSRYPKADPNGTLLGNRVVKVKAISTDRTRLSLENLPVGMRMNYGDKMQVKFGSNPQHSVMMECATQNQADELGDTILLDVNPYVYIGVEVGQTVILKQPACQMILRPGTLNVGVAQDLFVQGFEFEAIEKVYI